jgi:trafficking protein particle complex subunit 10
VYISNGYEKEKYNYVYVCLSAPLSTSYSVLLDYDPYNVWSLIEEDFNTHLPLRNLHWKSFNRPLRSIQSLHVEIRPYHPSTDDQSHQMPISLLQKPYLNIMLVKCDVPIPPLLI